MPTMSSYGRVVRYEQAAASTLKTVHLAMQCAERTCQDVCAVNIVTATV
jgi:hypothetical protein